MSTMTHIWNNNILCYIDTYLPVLTKHCKPTYTYRERAYRERGHIDRVYMPKWWLTDLNHSRWPPGWSSMVLRGDIS